MRTDTSDRGGTHPWPGEGLCRARLPRSLQRCLPWPFPEWKQPPFFPGSPLLGISAWTFSVLEMTDPRWGDFVARHPGATAFHHPDWARVVADCYGFRAFALASRDATGAIRAGLPVVEVRHFRSGPKWVSLPYTDYCPPLVSCRQEEDQLAFALQRASCAAGVRRVEIRAPLAGSAAAALQHSGTCSHSTAIRRRSMRVSIARRCSATSAVRNERD